MYIVTSILRYKMIIQLQVSKTLTSFSLLHWMQDRDLYLPRKVKASVRHSI